MLVYHGSKSYFNQFDYDKIGMNGTSEGIGFYFTNQRQIAEGYGSEGYLYEVEFNAVKSLSSTKKTITRQQLKKYLFELNKRVDYLSNFNDVDYYGVQKVLDEAVFCEYSSSSNDVDLVCSICHSTGSFETCLTVLNQVLGYDSIVMDADWGNGQKLYIALVPDVIDIVNVIEL